MFKSSRNPHSSSSSVEMNVVDMKGLKPLSVGRVQCGLQTGGGAACDWILQRLVEEQ